MSMQQITVVIVDDHPGVRAGIKKLLNYSKDIVVVGEGGDGAEAIRLANTKNPDIMLLDVELPVLRGEEVARQLRDKQSQVKILAISSYNDRQYILAMLENGAVGYITKDEAPDLLLEAVYSIVNSKNKWISPRAAQHARQEIPDEQSLTTREMDILNQLVLKKTEKEIAQSLNIDEKRLSRHLQLLKAKFGVDSLEDLRRSVRNYIGAHNVDQQNSH